MNRKKYKEYWNRRLPSRLRKQIGYMFGVPIEVLHSEFNEELYSKWLNGLLMPLNERINEWYAKGKTDD